MRIIKKDDKVVALLLNGVFEDGTKPITNETWSLQVVKLKHSKGKILPSHFHRPMPRTTERLMEALLVLKGKVMVSIFHNRELVEKAEITSAQCVIIVDGGIGIEVLEDAEMMEFKNGPFVEDKELI